MMARKEKYEAPPDMEFNNPFADLQIDNLPLGATPRGAVSGETIRKMGRVVLRKETAHRGGKTVIVIHDFEPRIPSASIDALARKLRQHCGCGGTTRERAIEIQGNHVQKIRDFLEQEGFRVAGIK